MNITELCAKYKTDKGIVNTTDDPRSWMHCYSLFYDILFRDLRDKELNVLDIGGWGNNSGGSSKVFREFFVNSHIYSLDICKEVNSLSSFNILPICLDLNNESQFIHCFNNLGIRFDIIIEDAQHTEKQQTRNLINMLPFVNRGGIYIIEDVCDNLNLLNSIKGKSKFNYCSDYEYYILSKKIKLIKLIKTNQISTLVYIQFCD